ncbi:hypothetical protein KEM52_003701 [Ascosphaera acerosa]|nr:hypothetical protein KEM52_003701 [Ascosphaera acerosa]
MALTSVLSIASVLQLLLTVVVAASQSVDVYQWPVRPGSTPSRLLSVSYDVSATVPKATITGWRPLGSAGGGANAVADADVDALVRIGMLDETTGQWRGSLVRQSLLLDTTKPLSLALHVDPASSRVVDVALSRSWQSTAGSTQRSADDASTTSPPAPEVTVVLPSPGPVPVLIEPVPVKQDGTPVQPVPEKSFLQKYWWIFLGIAVMGLANNNEPQN